MGIRQRLDFALDRKAGEVVTFAARAGISIGPLVSGAPSEPTFTHGGTRPQRISRTRAPALQRFPPRRRVVGPGVPADPGRDVRGGAYIVVTHLVVMRWVVR